MDAGDLDGSAADLQEVRARGGRGVLNGSNTKRHPRAHTFPAEVRRHPCLGGKDMHGKMMGSLQNRHLIHPWFRRYCCYLLSLAYARGHQLGFRVAKSHDSKIS